MAKLASRGVEGKASSMPSSSTRDGNMSARTSISGPGGKADIVRKRFSGLESPRISAREVISQANGHT